MRWRSTWLAPGRPNELMDGAVRSGEHAAAEVARQL
jgi:hypothetical protein